MYWPVIVIGLGLFIGYYLEQPTCRALVFEPGHITMPLCP